MNRGKIIRMSLAAAFVAASYSGAAVAEPVGLETLNGAPPAQGEVPSRVITIDAGTRWANAHQNEVVKLVVRNGSGAEQSIDWQFPVEQFAVDLSKIVPAIGRHVYVHLTPDSMIGAMD